VLALFPDHHEGVTAKACGAAIGKSDDRARQILEDLVLINLLVRRSGKSQGGVPAHVYASVRRMVEIRLAHQHTKQNKELIFGIAVKAGYMREWRRRARSIRRTCCHS